MIKLYNFLMKYGGLIALIFSVVVLAIFFVNITSGFSSTEGIDSSTDLAKYIRGKNAKPIDFFDFGLKAAIIMVFIAAIAWILFGLIGLVMNPKGSMKFLISFVIVAILYFIFYKGAVVEQSGRLAELLSDPAYHVDADISKHISAGLKTMLSLFGLSILSLIVSEIISFFK